MSQINVCLCCSLCYQYFARSIRFLLSFCVFYCLQSSLSIAEEALEFKVKTAYLYNFTKFVSWPPKNSPNFNLCLLGKHPFGNLLLSLESKTVLELPIRIVQLNNTKDNTNCHILYVDDLELLNNAQASAPPLRNALLISSQPGFAQHGGMIGFMMQDGKVRLEINLKALKQSGLTVSAQLLEVATIINRAPDE